MTPVSAPVRDRGKLAALSTALRISRGRAARTRPKLVGPDGHEHELPESAYYLLRRVAEVLARGDAITLVQVGRELTTQQAADLLNVSRQYLVRLLEEDKVPHTRTGKHRRLKLEDVLAYKAKRDKERAKGLAALTALTGEMGGYDDEL